MKSLLICHNTYQYLREALPFVPFQRMIINTTRRFLAVFISSFFVIWRDRRFRKWTFAPAFIILLGYLIPQQMIIPVQGATTQDWNVASFWAYPWGTSVTHRGIDIFNHKGTNVISATYGIVMYTHEGGKGGKAVMTLDSK